MRIIKQPWHIEIYDARGRLLTRTQNIGDPATFITPIPVVLLVKNHSVLPHIKVAQSTKDMDWNDVELRVFSTDSGPVSGLFTRPDSDLQTVSLIPRGRDFVLRQDPQAGRVKWTIKVQSLMR